MWLWEDAVLGVDPAPRAGMRSLPYRCALMITGTGVIGLRAKNVDPQNSSVTHRHRYIPVGYHAGRCGVMVMSGCRALRKRRRAICILRFIPAVDPPALLIPSSAIIAPVQPISPQQHLPCEGVRRTARTPTGRTGGCPRTARVVGRAEDSMRGAVLICVVAALAGAIIGFVGGVFRWLLQQGIGCASNSSSGRSGFPARAG